MASTAFIICPIFAGVLISVHPIFSVPFIIVAFLISSKWQPSSEGGIILGIILFFVIVTAVTLIAKAMGYSGSVVQSLSFGSFAVVEPTPNN